MQGVSGSSPLVSTKQKRHPRGTCDKAGAPTKFAHSGKRNRFAVKYLLRKCEMFALRTRANFISHRAKRDISQYAFAYYFTFCDSKTFHLYTLHPTIHLKGVTHYTLQGKVCEKEYEQNCSYSFWFFGRYCPCVSSWVESARDSTFALLGAASQFDYATLRSEWHGRTQPKPEGRTAMPFGSRREIKTCFMEGTTSCSFLF